MARLILILTLVLSLHFGQESVLEARPHSKANTSVSRFVTVSGRRFLDGRGRPLLLHGINVANKARDQGYVGDLTPNDFAAIRGWGMNCIRLAIFWDGLEPEPGRIDEVYLERIAERVEWAKAQGLYVLLDMHQDLYSVKFSDGAPAWATLDDGKPHTTGAVWSDAYYSSPAVQTALDHFWANSPAPDGVGLQDHYARVWRRVAERFRAEPTVIGYDLMNEPFPGRDASRMLQAALQRLSELLAVRLGPQAPSSEALFALQATPQGRRQIAEWLKDRALFAGMLEPAAPIMQEFERGRLMPMYARVRKAIREVDSQHILFLEPAMSANLGTPSALAPLTDQSGKRDPQQAYAPHGYDLVTDTGSIDLLSNERVALIFHRHAQLAKKLRMPMLVGEWGAYYGNPAAAAAARFTTRQFEELGCSDLYWAY
ncbi:MAG: glycoside hydrolase family 5 protein, partial [Acidobacteriia bacterium]|nr:glycoside hydrolase family 5 protein [Terriglobia bacterium]